MIAHRRAGGLLSEVLLAVALVAVALSVVALLLPSSYVTQRTAGQLREAQILCDTWLNRAKSGDFLALVNIAPTTVTAGGYEYNVEQTVLPVGTVPLNRLKLVRVTVTWSSALRSGKDRRSLVRELQLCAPFR